MHPPVHSADWMSAHVLLELALVTAACVLARWLLRNRNQPPVIAEILAGLALGPCVLGYLPGDLPRALFPVDTRPFLMILAQVGLVLFMFVVGFEIDLPALGRLRGSATSVAAASVLVPLGVGMAVTWWIRPAAASASGPASTQLVQALFIGVAFSATAFPVLARILDDTALKRLPIRGLALSAAAAGDVVSWTMLAAVVAVTRQAGSASTVILLAQFGALLLALRYVARPVVIAVLGRSNDDQPGLALTMSVILVGIFLSSCATAAMHLHPIFGAFAFGFACPRDVVCAKAAVEKLADASKILMPVFFVLTGLSMSVRNFGAHDVLVTVLVLISASAAKILSVYAAARACRVSSQDSWGLGLLMNTRGLTELVILDVGRTAGVLSARMFTILAVMAIGTTLITGPVMEKLYFGGGTGRFGWRGKWRGRRGQVQNASPVIEHLSEESNAHLGNRYVDAWPAGYATPNNSHHLDGESADSKP
jgi:Kef-type K+ transport system membrane component KefB